MYRAADAGAASTGGRRASAVIELSHVSKTYAPRFGRPARALDDVSFRVAAGEVAGIAGAAGAGKSTLVGLVLGFQRPTTGTVRVDGIEPRRFVEREGIAHLPEHAAFPWRWRVEDALTRLSMLSGVAAEHARERVESIMDELGLTAHRRTRVHALTPDARQRLGIAQAVVGACRVVVLDEPLEGLGAESVQRFRVLVDRLRAPDRSILLTSGDAALLYRIADRITVIDRGRVRRAGVTRASTPADVESVFHLVMHHGSEHVLAVFPSAISVGRGTFAVRVVGLGALNRGIRELVDRGALLASVTPAHGNAEPHSLATVTEVMS